jgi:hydrogenase maturation protein HypF
VREPTLRRGGSRGSAGSLDDLERLDEELLPGDDLEIVSTALTTAQLEAVQHGHPAAIAAAHLGGDLQDLKDRSGQLGFGHDDREAALERGRHDLTQVPDLDPHHGNGSASCIAQADLDDRAAERQLVHLSGEQQIERREDASWQPRPGSLRRSGHLLERVRALVHVEGTVQGVGFRPHVYRLATSLSLAGTARNDASGVAIDVEGEASAVELFLERLSGEAPPLAVIEQITVDHVAPAGAHGFALLPSGPRGAETPLVTPDAATCAECLRECNDPLDRRYRYPFINCTACGPRFTIVTGVPYDRPSTTMHAFEMCATCRCEYENPADRRFHAQPNACPQCGPAVRLIDRYGAPAATAGARDAVEAGARALLAGRILAVKALGGYQLACRADSEAAVALLRARKHREDKPLAIMAADLEQARRLVHIAPAEQLLLEGRERPIVLCRRRQAAAVAPSVAPGHRMLGVMLPSTPLHHLLAADAGVPLVMTSGNRGDEPISYLDDEALTRLASIADLLLLHDRPIHMRADDSVVRCVTLGGRRRRVTIRRARGYVPTPHYLPLPASRPILACGAELKSTLCVARGRHAWISQHIGDLRDYEALRSYREAADHLARLFAVEPAVVAHDMHPDYLSSAYALEREDVELVAIQHHHAHLAACLAEHAVTAPAIGVIFDGAGYGSDGTSWGGELLIGDLVGYERVGSLTAVAMPGGDAAVAQPWRMACAWLEAALGTPGPLPRMLADHVGEERWEAVTGLLAAELHTPLTSSVGRLFDAVAALCGLCAETTYEGQAAIALELAARRDEPGAYPLPVCDSGPLTLDARPTVRAVVEDLAAGVAVGRIAARFHNALVAAAFAACRSLRERHGIGRVVLSGGVFQNEILLERMAALLEADRFEVLAPQRVPCNDGGISFGQAAIAAARMHAEGRG